MCKKIHGTSREELRKKSILLGLFFIFLFPGVCNAIEYEPWFPPLAEFQGRVAYAFNREHRIESPIEDFNFQSNNHLLNFSLGITPWFYWNAEAELRLAHTSDITFTYEAFVLNGRYSWSDDIVGDPFSFTTGVSLFFPGKPFTRNLSFWYHGQVNAEIHAAIGREWKATRVWLYAGLGSAEKGSPWIRSLGAAEWEWFRQSTLSFFCETLIGFGSQDIISEEEFNGYARIAHRNILVGSQIEYEKECFGIWSLFGWYSVYAHNFPINNFGVGVSLLVPFSL